MHIVIGIRYIRMRVCLRACVGSVCMCVTGPILAAKIVIRHNIDWDISERERERESLREAVRV